MQILDIPEGPLVGRAWAYLKELRLERGPLGHDDAVEELLRWAEGQGLQLPPPEPPPLPKPDDPQASG